jgi:hypothetical protein
LCLLQREVQERNLGFSDRFDTVDPVQSLSYAHRENCVAAGEIDLRPVALDQLSGKPVRDGRCDRCWRRRWDDFRGRGQKRMRREKLAASFAELRAIRQDERL